MQSIAGGGTGSGRSQARWRGLRAHDLVAVVCVASLAMLGGCSDNELIPREQAVRAVFDRLDTDERRDDVTVRLESDIPHRFGDAERMWTVESSKGRWIGRLTRRQERSSTSSSQSLLTETYDARFRVLTPGAGHPGRYSCRRNFAQVLRPLSPSLLDYWKRCSIQPRAGARSRQTGGPVSSSSQGWSNSPIPSRLSAFQR